MNKSELISRVAAKTGMTKKDTDIAVSAAIRIICDTLSRGEEVKLTGFGTFETKIRSARTARNIRENTPVTVAPTKVVKFKPGKALKEALSDTASEDK